MIKTKKMQKSGFIKGNTQLHCDMCRKHHNKKQLDFREKYSFAESNMQWHCNKCRNQYDKKQFCIATLSKIFTLISNKHFSSEDESVHTTKKTTYY